MAILLELEVKKLQGNWFWSLEQVDLMLRWIKYSGGGGWCHGRLALVNRITGSSVTSFWWWRMDSVYVVTLNDLEDWWLWMVEVLETKTQHQTMIMLVDLLTLEEEIMVAATNQTWWLTGGTGGSRNGHYS